LGNKSPDYNLFAMKKHLFLILISALTLTSCSYRRAMQTDLREPITESLFTDKDRTLSEENIQKLLEGKLNLPDTLRIALFRYGMNNRYYSKFYSFADENAVKSQQSYIDTLVAGLKDNRRVKNVHPIPSLMLSSSPTITQLRETSVRLLSDLLIVYSTTSDIYFKYKTFKKDAAKAFATTEVLIMDIRTGLIPFSTTITKEFLTKTLPDETIEETRKRAEKEAVILTLLETGLRIDAFLKIDK
jgi:hypothetical protein